MESEGIFKTSVFGGFDKQSVLSYVDDLIAQQQKKEAEFKRRADALELERGQFASQADDLAARLREAEERLQEAESHTQADDSAQAELREKNARLRLLEQTLEQERARADALEKDLREARARADAFERDLTEANERSRKYDGAITQVGLVMVEAQNQADSIVGRARAQAEDIARESMEHTTIIISHRVGLCRQVDEVDASVGQLRSFAARTMEDVDRRIAALEEAVRETQGHLYISAGVTARTRQPEEAPPEPEPQEADSDFFGPAGSRQTN